MLPGSDPLLDDPLDEILFPQPTTPTVRALGKFQPKACGKPTKPAAQTSNAADKPPQPMSTSSSIPSHAQCPDLILTEENANQQDEGADILFGLESDDGQVQTSSATVRPAGRFQPKANPRLKDKKLEKTDDIISSSSSMVDAGPSEVNLVDESNQLVGDLMEASKDGDNVMEASDIHSEKPQGEGHALESNANLHEVSAIFDMESLVDPFFQSSVTIAERAKPKFQPKLCPKLSNLVPISSISDASKIVSDNLVPLPRASDLNCPEEELSLSAASGTVPSTKKTLNCELHASQEFGNLSNSSPLSGDTEEASKGDEERSGKASDTHFSMECLDDNMQHASTSGINDTHEVACQDGPQDSDSGRSLQINSDKPEEEILMDSGIESHDDIFLQPCSAAGVKKVSKFQPKSISRPKERKAKSVSFILPDAGEIAAPIETHSEVLEGHLTGANPSVQMMTNEFSDKIPHTTSNNADFQMDDSRLETQDLAVADLSGLESFDSTLSEPTLVTEQTVGKFRPRPKLGAKTKTRKSNYSTYTSEQDTCQMNTESLDEDVDLKTTDPISERDINIGAKRKSSEISKDVDNELHSLNVEEQTEQSESMDFQDQGASKSTRKLRNRVDVGSPGKLDGGNNEDQDIENDNSHLAEDRDDDNDDEYRGEDMPKKAAPKKSKKQKNGAQKPAQRHKVSKESDSTKNEPPKKRFPHGTRRKRRQVDKALLETPDYEINPKQLKIRDLIMLAEAKERISSKDTAAPMNNQSNDSSAFFSDGFDDMNPYGENHEVDEDEEHRNMLKNSRKLNYHSYMNKPQTGRWSKSETESFYEAIRQFGTDFAMIQQLFPNRSRHQVKLKFKNEERKNPLAIADAITHRSKDHSHFERVIQQLKAKAEESRLDDENGDPTVESQDAVNQNEEERPEKEEQEANGFDGEANNSEKYNEWDGENSEKYEWDGDGTTDFKEYEDSEWDAGASSSQNNKEHSEYDDFF